MWEIYARVKLVSACRYFSLTRPPGGGRSLLRDAAVSFDPLLAYFASLGQEHQGWCVFQNL